MHEARVLKGHLERELAACRTLLLLSARLQEALVARDSQAIHEISSRQTRQMGAMEARIAEGRGSLIALALSLGLDPATANVSQTASILEARAPELAASLCLLRDEIAACAEELTHANWVNAQLLESGMDGIRFTFRMLAEATSEREPVYAAAASPARPAASLLLDQRA